MGSHHKEEAITLDLLQAIDEEPHINQRHLAKRLGVALGLTNTYVKRSLQKGLIKIKQAPANRYKYYLTPKGFSEKSRLTGRYLSNSLRFYKQAYTSCERLFRVCHKNAWQRLLLCGVSELSEVATRVAEQFAVEIIGIYDVDATTDQQVLKPVWTNYDDIPDYDAALLTDLKEPFARRKLLLKQIDEGRLLIPDILGLDE